jgi:hypothetical protein
MYYQDSIEYKTDNIYHQKTRDYFNEVLSSYNNGNYRSAIVMLYSVVICDFIYKLQELSDRYSDADAMSILDKIKTEQKENPNNPKWEMTLITEVKTRTNLLEPQDFLNLEYLRSNRHLSAHPILDQLDMLLEPNKETVRANMVNMLDGILCKSPLLSKKVISTFLGDLASLKGQLIKDSDLESYLNSKYFNKINKPTEEKLFKDLWKFVFRLDDPKTNENREIIFKAILILFKKERTAFMSIIDRDRSYYSHINLENDSIFSLLLYFLSLTPNLYNTMDDSVKVIITTKASNNFSVFSKCVFLSDSLQLHFENIKQKINNHESLFVPRISDSARELLLVLSKEHGTVQDFLNVLIDLFKNSQSYDDADINFQEYILPYGDLFNKDQYLKILEAINDNSQLHNRRNTRRDNLSLKLLIEVNLLDDVIDFSNYPLFRL